MADDIAILDKFRTNTRYFIVYEIVMAAVTEHGKIITTPKHIGLLDLTTRQVMLIPIEVLHQQLETGNLWRWHVDYTLYIPKKKAA